MMSDNEAVLLASFEDTESQRLSDEREQFTAVGKSFG